MRHVDVAIGTEFDVIAAMTVAAAGAHEFPALIEGAVAVLVGEPEERLGHVRIREKGAVGVEQPAAFEELVVDDFHLLIAAAADRQAKQAFLLFAKRDATLRIEGHGDPGIFTRLRGADQLRFEAGRKRERRGIGRLVLRARFGELPGVVGVEGLLQIEGIGGRIGIRGSPHHGLLP